MIADWLLWSRALHIVGFVAWIAALWYLPRLYQHHLAVAVGTDGDGLLQALEHRLLKVVATPAMVVTFAFGLTAATVGGQWSFGWLHTKLLVVLVLAGLHGLIAADRKRFAKGERPRSVAVYRVLESAIVVLSVLAIFLAVFRPF